MKIRMSVVGGTGSAALSRSAGPRPIDLNTVEIRPDRIAPNSICCPARTVSNPDNEGSRRMPDRRAAGPDGI